MANEAAAVAAAAGTAPPVVREGVVAVLRRLQALPGVTDVLPVESMQTLSVAALGAFFCVVLLRLSQTPGMFVKRHARLHRLLGLVYLAWLLVGYADVFAPSGRARVVGVVHPVVYHAALGGLGTALTLAAAQAFGYQEKFKHKQASGTLDKHAFVTKSEMVEHAFYQAVLLVQILALHALALPGVPEPARLVLALAPVAPWLVRSYFPVNSFMKNYQGVSLRDMSTEQLLYRIKKWQYVFWKHGLLISLTLTSVFEPSIVDQRLFRVYWLFLNTSFTFEFFLQTLVKKRVIQQSEMLWLQKLLMAAGTLPAVYTVLCSVSLPATALSHVLNVYNRGHDVANTALVLASMWAGRRWAAAAV